MAKGYTLGPRTVRALKAKLNEKPDLSGIYRRKPGGGGDNSVFVYVYGHRAGVADVFDGSGVYGGLIRGISTSISFDPDTTYTPAQIFANAINTPVYVISVAELGYSPARHEIVFDDYFSGQLVSIPGADRPVVIIGGELNDINYNEVRHVLQTSRGNGYSSSSTSSHWSDKVQFDPCEEIAPVSAADTARTLSLLNFSNG